MKFRNFLWLALIGLLLVLAGCRADRRPERQVPSPPVQPAQTARPPVATIPFEEPDLPTPSDAVLEKEPPRPGPARPRVAIIIDDMGYHPKIGRRLLALDMNLTFSFLPGAPFTRELEAAAWEKGADILVHMPMQARDLAWNPGPGALYLQDPPAAIRKKVVANLAAVPHAIGCNNHMGSRFTEDAAAMRLVLAELKKRDLFFIDSYTTAASTGMAQARAMGIPTARRHVFLDNVHEEKKVCRQLEELVALAWKRGTAIGIGHPNQATLTALTRCRDRLMGKVELVPVHTLLNRGAANGGNRR